MDTTAPTGDDGHGGTAGLVLIGGGETAPAVLIAGGGDGQQQGTLAQMEEGEAALPLPAGHEGSPAQEQRKRPLFSALGPP